MTDKTKNDDLNFDTPIAERLSLIAAEVGAMEKEPVQNFQAFTIDTVYSTLRPLFQRFGVVVIPRVLEREYVERSRGGDRSPSIDARVLVEYKFVAPDGSSEYMRFGSEGRDVSDKATNKAVQQAFKYGLIQMFMISTGEVDPDAETVEDGFANTANQPKQPPRNGATFQGQTEGPGKVLSAPEKRIVDLRNAAYKLVYVEDSGDDLRSEAIALVNQTLGVYGGPPKNKGEVAEIIAMMTADMKDVG